MSKTFENSGSEKDFLKIYSNEELDKYAKPSVTVGKYALSSGFVQEQEDLNTAVCREVREETSVQLNTLITSSNSLQ